MNTDEQITLASHSRVWLFLFVACLLAVSIFNVAAVPTMIWTNQTGGNLLWSNPANWIGGEGTVANQPPRTNGTPTFPYDVEFVTTNNNTFVATNVQGVVNSIVDVDCMANILVFRVQEPGYHTVQINPGVTLATTNTQIELLSYRGLLSGNSNVGYVTIKGEGRMVLGDISTPSTAVGNFIRISQQATVGGPFSADLPYMVTLDMSGLNYFACAPGEIRIANATGNAGTRGTWILAKTNLVICGVTSTDFNGLTIGASGQNATTVIQPAGSIGDLQLGQANDFRMNSIKVGGGRAQLGTMRFRPGQVNPSVTIRNTDGSSPVALLTIGDSFQTRSTGVALSTTETSTGNMDMSGGTVDILVAQLNVGRNLGSATSASNGHGNGTLTWTAGTIDCTSFMDIGRQNHNNAGNCTGVVNVRSNAVLLANAIRIGSDLGGGAGTGNGALNITYGGQATVTGDVLEDSATTTGTSAVNLTNGSFTVGGQVRVDNFTAINSALSLVVGPSTTPANPVCSVTNLTLASTVVINVSGGGLTLASYPLIKYMGTIDGGGFAAVTLGTQPADTIGYLFNNTANKTIDLVVTNIPALRWNGNVDGNWNISGTSNWINTATSLAVAYQETFPPGDPVIFDESATGIKTVNLTTVLSPESVVVNNTTPYTFIGTGAISGTTDLYKTGSGTLELANIGVNDYTGPTTVSGGTLRVNGLIQNSAVTVQSGATLGGTGVISGPITIESAGTLAVGDSIGTLTINNNLVMSSGSSNVFEVDSDTLNHDQVAGGGFVTFGGTLMLNLTGGGTALTNGAAIQLFSTGVNGAFNSIVPSYPATGLYWDTSTLAINGTIGILEVPPGNLLIWTNVTGGDLLWSNSGNWIRTNNSFPGSLAPNSVPSVADDVNFINNPLLGSTNALGSVNNIVSTDTTVNTLSYRTLSPGYQTTLINPGVTLSVTNNDLFARTGEMFGFTGGVSANTSTGYVTIKGAGQIIVGDTANPSPLIGNYIRVQEQGTPGGPYVANQPFMATLDMSGLNYFASATGEIWVGSDATNAAGARGTWILANTNLLICGNTAANDFFGLTVGSCTGGNFQPAGSTGEIQLGQQNDIRTFAVRVGGARAQLGTMKFRSGLINPTVRMRRPDGVTEMRTLAVGDNAFTSVSGVTPTATSTAEISTGVLDLSGGTVDILVQSLRVGRNITGAGTSSGSANGTMTWTAGTMQTTGTADVGRQAANNRGSCTGVINVRSNAIWTGDDIRLGGDAGTETGTGNGTINIAYGGQVVMGRSITETGTSGSPGTSTINVTNGFLTTGEHIIVDNVSVMMGGVISNTGVLTVGTLVGNGKISGAVTLTNLLAPGASIGTLTITSNLILGATSTNVFEVNTDTLAHDMVVGISNLTYGGTLVISPSGGGTAITNGASAKIFDAASYSGSFAAIVPATPGLGLAWDTTALITNGTINIVASVNTTPTNLTFAVVGGNQLDISWPADRTGWRLEGQTNSLNVGISNNWFTVPGSASTNHVIVNLNPANGAVFYRLIYP